MPFTRHGWQVPDTGAEELPQPMAKANCGGPGTCTTCDNDVRNAYAAGQDRPPVEHR